ncbi:hypothetical protein CK203_090631 [Vitis vinifera]|uniref:Uncharacterized protein n=1 Tax=Vitis vinifera TaxID=29760 RepID=A0A438DVY5_VITVI|nr:hypothetical protein CK203_090631 [Vitis vinifera]
MLVVNCGAIGVLPRRLPWTNVCLCSASNIGTDQLRAQLDQLHYEANNARAKADLKRENLRSLRLCLAPEGTKFLARVEEYDILEGFPQIEAKLSLCSLVSGGARGERPRANNARLRLMRLSEAAERLRRQAAISVQTGKENEARELLFQKKKVMQALEKSKSRIELLDELSAKLNEENTLLYLL